MLADGVTTGYASRGARRDDRIRRRSGLGSPGIDPSPGYGPRLVSFSRVPCPLNLRACLRELGPWLTRAPG